MGWTFLNNLSTTIEGSRFLSGFEGGGQEFNGGWGGRTAPRRAPRLKTERGWPVPVRDKRRPDESIRCL